MIVVKRLISIVHDSNWYYQLSFILRFCVATFYQLGIYQTSKLNFWIEYQSLIIDNCPIRLSLLNFDNLKAYRGQKCIMLVINSHMFSFLNLICFVFSSETVISTKHPDTQNNLTFNSAKRSSEKYVSKVDKLPAYNCNLAINFIGFKSNENLIMFP